MESIVGNVIPVRSTKVDRMCVPESELLAMLPQLKPYIHIFYTDPASVKDLVDYWLVSKLWRMNNLYKVQTKSVDDEGEVVVPFAMRMQQLVLYCTLVGHPRVTVLKSRQIGISTVTVLMYGDDMITTPHLKVGIVAQDQESANGLKDKISFAFDHLDEDIKGFLGVVPVLSNDSTFSLSNGSRVVAKLSFRSGTLHRFAWTEVGKIANNDPKRIIETLSGSFQALAPTKNNWVVKESTAEGDNYFKEDFYKAVKKIGEPIGNKETRPLFFSWLIDSTCNSMTPVLVDARLEKIVRQIETEFSAYIQTPEYRMQIGNFIYPDGFEYKLSDSQKWWMVGTLESELQWDLELFFREYPHTPDSAFYTSQEGVWYKEAMQRMREDGRIVYSKPLVIAKDDEGFNISGKYYGISDLYNPDYEVLAITDIGLRDRFFILYVQIIDTGRTTNDGLDIWDIRVLAEDYGTDMKTDKYAEMMEKQPYVIDWVILPHDGGRGTVLKDSVSVENDFQDMGYRTWVSERTTAKVADIIHTRRMLSTTRIDATYAPEIVVNLSNYKKKFDRQLQQYTDTPVHDIHSHGADAMRYTALSEFTSSKRFSRSRKILTMNVQASYNDEGGTVGI